MSHFSQQQLSETFSADVDGRSNAHAIAAFIAANAPSARRTAFNRARIAEALKRIPPVCAACAQPGHTIQKCAGIRKDLFR